MIPPGVMVRKPNLYF